MAALFTESEAAAAPLLAAVADVLTAMERQYPAPFQAALTALRDGGKRRVSALRAALRGNVGGAGQSPVRDGGVLGWFGSYRLLVHW